MPAQPVTNDESGWRYYEYKFPVPLARLQATRLILESLHGGTDPYPADWVNTRYFDTLDRRCYDECEAGLACKRKFRIRGYDDGPYTRAQMKEKSLSAVAKRSASIDSASHCESWPMLSGETPEHIAIRSLAAAYGPLVPAVNIRYFRRRYRAFDYRITLDENITATACPQHRQATRSVVQIPIAVLEVKTRADRPYLPGLGKLELEPSSFSKFLLGLTLLEGKPDTLNKYL